MDDVKTMIINESLELFNEKGYDFTLDELTSRLHISKKTIYKYFHGKEDIFREVILESFDSVHAKQQEYYDDSSLSIEEKLVAILNTRSKYENLVSIEKTNGLQEHYPDLYVLLMKNYATQWDKVEDLLHEGMDEKIFRSDLNVPLVENLLIEGMQMMHRDNVLRKSGLSYREAIKEVVGFVLNGIKVR